MPGQPLGCECFGGTEFPQAGRGGEPGGGLAEREIQEIHRFGAGGDSALPELRDVVRQQATPDDVIEYLREQQEFAKTPVANAGGILPSGDDWLCIQVPATSPLRFFAYGSAELMQRRGGLTRKRLSRGAR